LEYLSSELEEDLPPSALAKVGENLVRWTALKVDAGLLEGTGAGPGIVGLRNVSGANSTSVAATPTNFAKFRDAEYELLVDNGEPRVWVMHPRSWKTLFGDQDRHLER
jgi:Phage capsid family